MPLDCAAFLLIIESILEFNVKFTMFHMELGHATVFMYRSAPEFSQWKILQSGENAADSSAVGCHQKCHVFVGRVIHNTAYKGRGSFS